MDGGLAVLNCHIWSYGGAGHDCVRLYKAGNVKQLKYFWKMPQARWHAVSPRAQQNTSTITTITCSKSLNNEEQGSAVRLRKENGQSMRSERI